jgi:hypothetical protein
MPAAPPNILAAALARIPPDRELASVLAGIRTMLQHPEMTSVRASETLPIASRITNLLHTGRRQAYSRVQAGIPLSTIEAPLRPSVGETPLGQALLSMVSEAQTNRQKLKLDLFGALIQALGGPENARILKKKYPESHNYLVQLLQHAGSTPGELRQDFPNEDRLPR